MAILRQFQFTSMDWALATPHASRPPRHAVAIVLVSIPLAVAVLGAENMQAIGVLRSLDSRPPVTAMTVASGVGDVLAGLFGGHNADIAGPATAACAAPDAGPCGAATSSL